ncbi:glucans biosynthesis glucosyltransferase MdoH [Deltaproteobacteria bacterium Smac51]|nr:glucans biosynthesis glucosyltransferase MdoH [Deltaproteobacteria bacterium Smac51]
MNPFSAEIWERAGGRRRLALLLLVTVPSLMSAQIMYSMLPAQGLLGLNLLVVVLFAVLFSWISVGFWSSVAGLAVLLRRYDRFKVTLNLGELAVPDGFKTALLFPVYHEDMDKVTEGIRATLLSLRARGIEHHFDTFILSDSTNPDAWVTEEEAWFGLCQREKLFGRLFYRRRKSNLKRKSGNIADFCRRWGADYKYMIVFDADSIMAGEALGRMVQAMEAHPEIGILQSPPKVVMSRTLLARLQQFSNHLYGPIFAAGLHFWQLGDAQFWGHNAIIRIEPFIKHCQLPKLPGRAPLGGEILSHDFVESALMRRAGYGVWLAYELGGSYEQSPPNLIDELARDRRWCQGNLQHSRLIFTQGFFPTHRALFINGIMSYGSALLWLFFLVASSVQALSLLFITPDYFPSGAPSLFPEWPQYFPTWALTLLSSTAALLFLPKLMAIVLVTAKGGARAFGGVFRMILSVLLEVVVSTFLAPVRMIFHSFFVLTTILGAKVGWNAQNRDDSGTRWVEAFRCHWWGAAFGLVWGALMLFFSPGFFIWLSPVTAGLALSIPLSVWTSRISLGRAARKAGLFLTPPETSPPREIFDYQKGLRERQKEDPSAFAVRSRGFARAVVHPGVLALHSLLAANKRRRTPLRNEWLNDLMEKALAKGPEALSSKEKHALLNAPDFLAELHRKVWSLEGRKAAKWGLG